MKVFLGAEVVSPGEAVRSSRQMDFKREDGFTHQSVPNVPLLFLYKRRKPAYRQVVGTSQ